MTMTVATFSAGEYEAAIATANYGKVVNGIKAFRISFADRRGRAVSNIGSAYAEMNISFDGAETAVLYKANGSLALADQDAQGSFSFDIRKAGTYAAAGLVSDGVSRAYGTRSGRNTVFGLSEAGTDISVTAPRGAFSGNVLMEAKAVAAESVAELAAAAMEEGAFAGVAGAFDISFSSANGAEQQPAQSVEVTIALPLDMSKNYQLIHIGDDGVASVVENAVFTESGVTFTAAGFSIYVVTETVPRMTYIFRNGEEVLSTQVVKEGDTLVDPGVGKLSEKEQFGGWYKDAGLTDGPYTIEDLNNQLASGTFTNGETVNVYTKIVDVYKIVYKDENDQIVKNETIAVEHGAASFTYTTDISYIPPMNNQEFRGWKYKGVDYANGQTITVDPAEDIELVADIRSGYWITFDENDRPDENTNYNAVYIGPKLIAQGETFNLKTDYATSAKGYVFDGWYTAATGGTRFDTVSYDQLSGDVTYYAHWSSATTAKYTVIVWMQKASDDHTKTSDADRDYDFYSSMTRTGTVGSRPSVPTAATGISLTGFNYSSNDAASKTVAQDGSTVVNVFYNRKVVNYTFRYYYTKIDGVYIEDGRATPDNLNTNTTYYNEIGDEITYRTFGFGSKCWRIYQTWLFVVPTYLKYTGNVYTRSVKTITGLYGAEFPAGFEWSKNTKWYHDGSITTFLTHFSVAEDVTFTNLGEADTGRTYRHYKENLNGTYSLAFETVGGTESFVFTNKFVGFTVYGYTRDSFNPNGIRQVNVEESVALNTSNLYVYHKRNSYALNFIDKDNNTVHAPVQVPYEKSLAEYASYEPDSVPDGKYFAGWYKSTDFSGEKFDFANETMDTTNGKTVVANFADEHFRIVIHPNNGEAEPSFMAEYEEQIQPNPYTKENYSLVGWYTDEACTKPYNVATLLTNKTEGMDTAYREEAEPSIRGKIEIYAKWRRSGNDGMIRLRYEARNGDAPADPNYYTDQGDAFIAPAPENVAGEDQFLYWTFKGGKYYPGQIFVVEADDAEKATYDGEEANWITFAAVYGTPTTAPTTTIKIDLLGGGMLKDSYVATLRTEVESSGATVTKEDNGNVTIKNIPLNQEFTLPELDDVENLKRGYVFDDCWTTQEGVKTEDATFDAGAKVAGDLNDRPTNPDENTVYAFWNKYFYIYHSGDGSWENVPVFDTKERNEYTKEGYYYGGYGVLADAAAELPNGLTYSNGTISGTPGFTWDWDTAEYSGDAFDRQVGDVYYIKEVEGSYLPTPKVIVVKEDYGNGVISAIRILSAADTDIYYWGGAKIDGSDVNGFISKKYTLTQNGTGKSTTFQTSDLGIADGYVIVANGNVAAGEHTYEPYWYTLDEVTVYGGTAKSKTVTISGDLKSLT